MDHWFIHWLGHASFRLDDEDRSIYIDPWKLPAASPPASLILITHPHYDHLSAPDIARVTAAGTLLVAPADTAQRLTQPCLVARPGESLVAGDWHIEAVPAYTLSSTYHPKARGWVGYKIRLKSGTTVFHSGDTDRTPELEAVRSDAVLLACGGTYTMDGREAGRAANAMGPRIVVPMHWGDIVGSRKDAELLRAAFKGETVIKEAER